MSGSPHVHAANACHGALAQAPYRSTQGQHRCSATTVQTFASSNEPIASGLSTDLQAEGHRVPILQAIDAADSPSRAMRANHRDRYRLLEVFRI
jgi:hypothetical protein